MRAGGILQAGAEILAQALPGRQPLSAILQDWGKAHRFAGARDRAAIGNLTYDALRRRASLSYKMGSDSPEALAWGALLAQGDYADIAALEAAMAGEKFAPPPLPVAQKRAWAETDLSAAAGWIQADIPQWCGDDFAQSFGAGWVAEGRALAERPPLDMRVNALKAEREKLAARLAPQGAGIMPLTPFALRIAAAKGSARQPNVQAEPAFQRGLFEVQDCGSQMAARLCAAQPGEQVLDYCAGGGGKTLALAADMQNRGQIHAYDADKTRLAPIFERLRRAGARNVQAQVRADALEPLAAHMDCVLLDAPCSGAGTWRRHPDTKWRLSAAKLEPRLAEQRKVLAAGARFVKPGGRLVYVTCSLLPQENDAQIARFLAENSGFALADMRAAWAQALPAEAAGILPRFTPCGLLMSPAQTQTDGFFVSILRKAAA